MKCIKCKREIPDGSLFCNYCGKKQTVVKSKTHKRAHGSGTIVHDKRYKKEWLAYAPSNRQGRNRIYVGAYLTRKEAQAALEKFVQKERPELYNATLEKIYELWSDIHYKRVSESAISLYSAMWKRFEPIQGMKVREIKTAHLQKIINTGTSKSACDTLKAISVMLCRYAMENDIVDKNYAEFIKIPKFEKKEKRIFTPEEIQILWKHTDDYIVQIILFMIYTGLRIGEMTSLKVSDIYMDEGYIVGGEKTEAGKNRVVPIPSEIPELRVFISQWLTHADTDKVLNMTPQSFRKQFYATLIKYEIQAEGTRDLTPHSTRHTFASISSQAGIKPENLQKIIGHSNFQTTANTYIHQNLEELQKEMSKIKK